MSDLPDRPIAALYTAADLVAALRSAGEERDKVHEKETARLWAVVARLRQMTDHWEKQLPEVIRTPAVVSAIRAALEAADVPSVPAEEYAGGSYLTAEHETLGMIAARYGGDLLMWELANPWVTSTAMPLPAGLRVAIPDADKERPAVPSAPADRAERVERYAVAIHDAMEPDLSLVDEDPAVQAVVDRAAEAAMAVANAEQAAKPTDRAAILREAIDVAREEGHRIQAEQGIEAARGARSVAYLLRKLLVKADMPVDWAVVAYRSPSTRALYCVICARQETGWQPVAADALPDGDTVCDFCGGRVLAIASRTLGDVVARYMPATETQQQS